MLRNILIFTGLLALTLSAQAAEKVRTAKLPNGLTVHEYKLKNGLQILLVPDRAAPVFSIQSWFRVGSASEKLDPKLKRTGLAHFFEHMMFRGTKKHKDGEFDHIISAAGAVGNNATTWYDRTNYFESLPKEQLDLILGLESDRMVNLVLNKKLFDTERGAVIGELKMGKDKPGRVANDYLWDLALDVHPYKYTVIGTEEELMSFTVEDGQYFYKTYYSPNNATLIILGDIEIKNALSLIEKHYGDIPAQKIPDRITPKEPEQKEARRKEATHPLATSELFLLGFKSPELSNKDFAAIEAIAAVLGYGESSPLEQSLVAKGFASRVGIYPYKLKDPGLFIINVDVAPGKSASEVEKIVNEAVANIRAGKITEQDLERGRNQYLLAQYSELKNLSNIGDFMGESLMSSNNYLRSFEVLEELKRLTVDDLKRVATKYLTPQRSSVVIVRPENK